MDTLGHMEFCFWLVHESAPAFWVLLVRVAMALKDQRAF
jgi:hypothetical protein